MEEGPAVCEICKLTILDRYISLEMWKEKVLELINFFQRSPSVREYVLKFTELSNMHQQLLQI